MAAIINDKNYPLCPDCNKLLAGGSTEQGVAVTKGDESDLYIERRWASCGHAHEYVMSRDLDHRQNITDVEITRINKKQEGI